MHEEKTIVQKFIVNHQKSFLSHHSIWPINSQKMRLTWSKDIKEALPFSDEFNPLIKKREAILASENISHRTMLITWLIKKYPVPQENGHMNGDGFIEFSEGLYIARQPLISGSRVLDLKLTSEINAAELLSIETQSILFENFSKLFSQSKYVYARVKSDGEVSESFNSMAYEQGKR